MARVSQRDKIIEAAEKLVTRVGAAHLTLDAVAEEAGVSKGGLLYHFKTKNELMEAILHEFIEAKIAAVEEQKRLAKDGESSELEAHLKALTKILCGDHNNRELGVAIMAVIANNPELLAPFQEYFDVTADKLWGKKSNFNSDAAILWLAAEGLRFFTLIQHEPFTGNQRELIIERLLTRAKCLREKVE